MKKEKIFWCFSISRWHFIWYYFIEKLKWLQTWLVALCLALCGEKNWCRLSNEFIRVQNFNANQMCIYCYYYCNYVNAFDCCLLLNAFTHNTRTHTGVHVCNEAFYVWNVCTALVIFKWMLEKIQRKIIELNFHFHLKYKNTCTQHADTHTHTRIGTLTHSSMDTMKLIKLWCVIP